jgi:hypothetical protein
MARTGFTQTLQGLSISKDPEARLTYTLDWTDWLPTGDTVSTVVWTIGARVNDPAPLVNVSSGIQTGKLTYIELSGGQVNKIYTVTAKVTTADGLIDRRAFRVRVENRSA